MTLSGSRHDLCCSCC